MGVLKSWGGGGSITQRVCGALLPLLCAVVRLDTAWLGSLFIAQSQSIAVGSHVAN